MKKMLVALALVSTPQMSFAADPINDVDIGQYGRSGDFSSQGFERGPRDGRGGRGYQVQSQALAQSLAQQLNQLSNLSFSQSQFARDPYVSGELSQLAYQTRNLSYSVSRDVVRPLYRNDERQAKYGLQRLDREFQQATVTFRNVERTARRLDPEVSRLGRSIAVTRNQLISSFDRFGRPGFPGYPGVPGQPAFWQGQCRVTLETIWGKDIQHFYGQAQGYSELQAVSLAKRDALQQCDQRRSNLAKCTVHEPECGAVRVGRGGRGGGGWR